MKLNPLLLSLFLFTVTPSSHAINVGDVTSIMGPDASTLAKEIINTTDTARYVSVSVERISSPMAGGTCYPDGEQIGIIINASQPDITRKCQRELSFFLQRTSGQPGTLLPHILDR
ncbi:CFA/I fimbrial auxiliary subunit [Klebsiella michiganensis]|uniref:CFA/I fimbrial auxiliary subunit n=1 Tax=Klebsiella michiganensis TaxID=1134687 RepID=A0A7H4N5F6_9ENTR|nr:CFA/I fimbrial auxiliary subunit [Klebsiella michiganensis]